MSETTTANPRLSHRLKRILLATLLTVLILATIAAAVSAYLEASDIQDETLLSVARLVETNQIGSQRDNGLSDKRLDDTAVRVWETGKKNRHGFSIDKPLRNGFHTLFEDDDLWRVYATGDNKSETQYVVAQKLAVSAELALKSAVNTAIPLLLLFLLVPILTTLIVRHSFKPLNTLADKVGSSDSLMLDLADEKGIPVEILPFVSAIDTLLKKNETFNLKQRRFIADAAHELRTPITALSLEIENVNSAKNDTVRKERQAALKTSVSRLQHLLNQLLDLARAQSGMHESRTVISFNDLVKTQIAELYLLMESKEITVNVSRNEPVTVTDSNNQLQHLVRNALSNAIKFTPEQGSISIELYRQGSQAIFRVTDSGPGVSPEHLNQLHEPFYSPDGQISGHGAGLGLAICHEIAKNLHGTLKLDNAEPTGFVFRYSQSVSNETEHRTGRPL